VNEKSSVVIFVDGDFTAPSSGSHVRFAEALHWAISVAESVTIYSYRQHPTQPWTEAAQSRFLAKFPDASLVLEEEPVGLKVLTTLRNMLLMLAPWAARWLLSRSILHSNPSLRTLLANPRTKLLVHFADSCTRLDGVPLERTIVDTHDIKWIRYSKLRGIPFWKLKSILRLRSEIAVLSSVRAIVAISSFESAFFKAAVPSVETLFIPAFPAVVPTIARPPTKDIDLLFVGSDWSFNVTGLAEFMRAEGTRLGHLRLAVAGKVGGATEVRTAAKAWQNVQLLGFVDELDELYARSRVVIAPVAGTGLNIKVVEALSHGKPEFASEAVLASLPAGFEGAVFPICAGQLELLLDDERWCARAEAAALRYSNELRAGPDLDRLERMLNEP
jgi:glycosyltransferase involved in cell wall biosynthesis